VLGRLGAPALADTAMWLAAGCGITAFGIAAVSTVRAARRVGRRAPREGSR